MRTRSSIVRTEIEEQKAPTVIELCAGAGGLALGLSHAGFEHAAMIEREAVCCDTLRKNGFDNIIHNHVEDVDFEAFRGVDMVAGGVPCQPFSNGGVDRGPLDKRDLWQQAVRAVREAQPRAFLFENVAGLLRPKFAEYLGNVLQQMRDLGYEVQVWKMNAKDYGVGQNRRRIFVVGTAAGERVPNMPAAEERPTLLGQVLEGIDPPTGCDLKFTTACPGHSGSVLTKPAKTLIAGAHGPGQGNNALRLSDGRLRHFSIREAAAVQSFPLDYWFCGSWTRKMQQIGNAVPPRLSALVSGALREALG